MKNPRSIETPGLAENGLLENLQPIDTPSLAESGLLENPQPIETPDLAESGLLENLQPIETHGLAESGLLENLQPIETPGLAESGLLENLQPIETPGLAESNLPEKLPEAESKSYDMIHTADELMAAMLQQAEDLNEEYIFTVGSVLDVTELINETEFEYLESIKWVYNYIADADGNEVPQEYNDYEFYATYRDDYKAFAAHLDTSLRYKLTLRELELLDKAEEIITEIIHHEMSDYQKVLAVHDYLVLNAEYDTRADTDSLPESNQRAEGVLLNGMGVCSSFASATKLLLGMVNIECLYVVGKGIRKDGSTESHAWNKVKIEGEWYNIDTTWDNPVPKRPGEVRYGYMCVTDDMLARDHIWDRSAYPKADSIKYNYYYYNGLIVSGYEDFKTIIRNAIANSTGSVIMARAYVMDYDEAEYNLQFVYDILPDIKRVSYSLFNVSEDGDEGEMIIWAYTTEN